MTRAATTPAPAPAHRRAEGDAGARGRATPRARGHDRAPGRWSSLALHGHGGPRALGAALVDTSPGERLPPAAQRHYERRLGRALPDVRIHRDDGAARLADGLGAAAFTRGPDIYFGAGRYEPEAPRGRALLAHELTHTLQQADSPARDPRVASPGDPEERAAARVASSGLILPSAYTGRGGAAIHRQPVAAPPPAPAAVDPWAGAGAGGLGGGGDFGGGGATGSWDEPAPPPAPPAPGPAPPAQPAPTLTGPQALDELIRRLGMRRGTRPGCDIEFDPIQLFGEKSWQWPLFDRSWSRELWRGRLGLGSWGFIEFLVTGRLRAASILFAGIGPGMIRDICLGFDPVAMRGTGSAMLHIPGYIGPQLTLGGSLHGDASYLGVIPLLGAEGGLVGVGRASAVGALMAPIVVTIDPSGILLTASAELGFGPYLTFDLDAWLAASVLGEEVARKTWNLVNWRWGTAWKIGVRMTLGYQNGEILGPHFEWYFDSIPIEDILPPALSGAAQDQQTAAAAATLTPSTEVPMLDQATVDAIKAAMAAGNREEALRLTNDALVRGGHMDPSKYTINYDPALGIDGEVNTRYRCDPATDLCTPSGPSTMRIGPTAFQNISWLVSTVMHEYQHVVQHQRERRRADIPSESDRAAFEVEAYLWEIEHSDETGERSRPADMRELGRRLTREYNDLGAADPARQATYRERYERAMEIVRDATTTATGASGGAGPSTIGAAGNRGSATAPVDLFAFGNRSAPRAPRRGVDIDVNPDDTVDPQPDSAPPWPRGASTFGDPMATPRPCGHYHRIGAGTNLRGLHAMRDDASVGGSAPPTHHTIYPIDRMRFDDFSSRFLGLGWAYAGNKPCP